MYVYIYMDIHIGDLSKDMYVYIYTYIYIYIYIYRRIAVGLPTERWGAGVETQKNVRGEVGRWGRVPFNEPYAPSLSTIYDGA